MPNPAPYLPPVMSDVVIDLYHGDNVNVDFSVIRSENIDAVILKASQGTWTDPTFLERVQEVRAAGLLVGAYHFLDGSSPADQIAHFLTVAGRRQALIGSPSIGSLIHPHRRPSCRLRRQQRAFMLQPINGR